MGRKVRTARGEVVDFDLLRIKEQISSTPPPIDVKQRQDFVEKRLRRRLKKTAAVLPEVSVEPKLPSTEDAVQASPIKVEPEKPQPSKVEEPTNTDAATVKPKTKRKTKQRARVS